VKSYLLDTHVFLWAIREPKRLSNAARKVLENPNSNLFVSSITPWEIAMKYRVGKMPEAIYVLPQFATHLQTLNARDLGFSLEHGLETSNVKLPHGDPFDRGLFAQAKLEGFTLISADSAFEDAVGVKVLW
jgi:PIN domain nuclease of toxin-antitoxin system